MQAHEQPMVVASGTRSIEPPITDNFGRVFDYLRLAVNDQCNLRCIYCMPEKGISFLEPKKTFGDQRGQETYKDLFCLGGV